MLLNKRNRQKQQQFQSTSHTTAEEDLQQQQSLLLANTQKKIKMDLNNHINKNATIQQLQSQPALSNQNIQTTAITTTEEQNVNNAIQQQKIISSSMTAVIAAEQNLYKTVTFYQNTENYKEFKKLKYKNDIYQVKDIVFIKNVEDMNNDFVGYLSKIILINASNEVKPIIQVTWFYKKSDLPKKYLPYLNSISDHEVFETDHTDYAYIDTINGHCQVLSYKDYDQIIKDNNIYFTRAKYDIKKQKIYDPPIEYWEQSCVCKMPINPDLQYICCDVCQNWFHIKCMKITIQQANKIQQWTCNTCKQQQQYQQQISST